MAADQIVTSVTIISSALKGWQAVSLSAMATSAVSVIEGGSTVEVAGAFFRFATDTSATAFSSISTAATAYLALEPSGTAGSQILSAEWVAGAPVWVPAKQGYYTTADSVIRVVGGGVKTGTSTLEPKFLFDAKQWAHNQDLRTTDAAAFTGVSADGGLTFLKRKTIDIGDWNMDTTANLNRAHGLTLSAIRGVDVLIRNDAGTVTRQLTYNPGSPAGYYDLVDTTVNMQRTESGGFDNVSYDSTSYNRGWIVIWYV
jgi:hypothetical protein